MAACRSRGVLGPAADGDYPRRHLHRHVHPDRSRCSGRRVRRLRRPVRVQGSDHPRMPESAAGVRQADHHADVHYCQRHALRSRADHRADPAADYCMGSGVGSTAMAVPAGGERRVAGSRCLHGTVGDHPDSGADPVPDCHATGHRPDSPGHHHGGEHGNRPDHAAGGAEPVRHLSGDRHAADRRNPRSHAVADAAAQLPDDHYLHPGRVHGTAELAGRELSEPTDTPSPGLVPGFFMVYRIFRGNDWLNTGLASLCECLLLVACCLLLVACCLFRIVALC
ncbi:hypothetical protein PSEUDO8Z_60002 [Pseudomonas sp. 8Z]|nr:hypothetical protein PSEUDO8Z_60002 [Pseudomonas sp. 8Z]